MTDSAHNAAQSSQEFTWHPEYSGKTFEEVRRTLIDDITRDQRAYHQALEDAEKEEFGAFNSVREVEKRWSEYDFGWFDVPPDSLANKILAFERDREGRQEMFSWQDWKAQSAPDPMPAAPTEKRDWRENMTDEQRRKLASALSILVLATFALVCVGAYMLIR